MSFQDLKYALRLFYLKPGFAVVSVLTLAIGIGANTVVFSVVNSFLLRPLPYHEPDRIVMIQRTAASGDSRSVYSYPVFTDVREQAQSFEDVAAFAYTRLTFESDEGPEIVFGSRVTGNFFSVLGVTPTLGRSFLLGEDEPNRPGIVILSHGLWQRRFGADPGVVGRAFTSNNLTFEIVGVMPPAFRFDLLPQIPDVEFWTPLNPDSGMVEARNVSWLGLIARLESEATLSQARTELATIAERINRSTGASPGREVALNAISLKEFFVGDARKPLLILFGAVGFVLLIACVNVANLLLAHGVGRRKELAIRAVLGASRQRLVRQMLTESLTMSVLGGLLGYLLVAWSLDALLWFIPAEMIRMSEITLDNSVLLFTLGASVLTGVLFGLPPSLQASKPDLQSPLKLGVSMAGGTGAGFRGVLVVTEVALAVVLLIGAGLMINSFVRLTTVDVGFDPDNVLSMELRMLARQTGPEQAAFNGELLERVRQMPGVKHAAIINALPTRGGASQTNKRSGFLEPPVSGDPDADLTIDPRSITDGYFQTMGIRLVSGRLFTGADNRDSQPVAIVSQRLAREAWPGEDPIGKRLIWGRTRDQRTTVVGVVTDVRNSSPDQEPTPLLYVPFSQNPGPIANLAVRAFSDPISLTAAVRRQVLEVDERVAVADVMTMERRLGELVAKPRFHALLMGIFGATGMLLSVVGLYGVISYTVGQRTHEIGIRMALGAQAKDIFRLVVGQGMLLTLAGIGIGVTGAYVLGRFLESLLFEVSSTDVMTFATVSLLLAAVALAACHLPARKASRVAPIDALRHE